MGNRKWYYINCKILPAKLSYFFYMARSAYTPFMLIYLKELGLDSRKAGLVYGLHFLGNVIGGPTLTYIADKFNVHRKVLRIISMLSLIIMTITPFAGVIVPKASSNQCLRVKNITRHTSNNNTVEEDSNKRNEETLFYLTLLLFLLASLFGDSLIGFIESATVEKCTLELKSSYSHQRVFGTIGTPFGIFLIRLFTDYFPLSQVTCYSGLFIVYLFNTLLLIMSCHFLMKDVTFGKADDALKNSKLESWLAVKRTLKQPKHVLFIVTIIFQGMMQGVHMNITFLYLKELNAANAYLTLYIVLTSGVTGLTLFVSKYTVGKIENIWLIFLVTSASYSIRYFLFYITTNLWILYLSGVLQAAHGAFIVTKIRYVKEECPKQVATTFYGITSSCYRSLGFVIVNLLGGIPYNKSRSKFLFLYATILAAVWSFLMLLYMLFTTYHCRKKNSKRRNNNEYVTLK